MKKRILIVDDDPMVNEAVKASLEATGRYEVCTETQGKMAIQTARRFWPDFILLDVMIPDLLGSEIAVQLQEDAVLKFVKFAFFTSMLSESEVNEAGGRIGGQAFIAKPFDPDKLCRFIDDQLSKD